MTIAALGCAQPVAAQVAPLPGQPWPNALDQARDQADRHRHEIERLRFEADQREAFARQQALEARLRVMDLQAARQPVPPAAYAPYPTGTPEQAQARGETVVRGTTQIDDWLDRRPRQASSGASLGLLRRSGLACGTAGQGERTDALEGWTSRRRH